MDNKKSVACPHCLIQVEESFLPYHNNICMAKMNESGMDNKKKGVIEIREDCKQCGGKIVNARFRTFCCTSCRIKFNNGVYREYHRVWTNNKRAKMRGLDTAIDRGV